MSWLEVYLLFMLATAFTAHYEIISPVMNSLEVLDPQHELIRNKIPAHLAFFSMSALFAPPIFLISVVPSWSERFKISMLNSLIKD